MAMISTTGVLLALAFPDRAQRRVEEPRFLLRGGAGAAVKRGDALADAPFLAIAELDGAPPEYRVARGADHAR
jgi:ATP-dependent helicase HrpB